MNTIDAMKQAQWLIARQKEWMHAVPQDEVLPAMPGFDGDYAAEIETALSAAIAREEAQTVEPAAWISPAMLEVLLTHPSGHTVLCGRRSSPGRTIPLFAHPAPPPSGEQDATEGLRTWAGITEREALVAELRDLIDLHTWAYDVVGRAADMLAADAQKITTLKEWQTYSLNEIARLETCLANPAQQVAVPQGFGELIRIAAWLLSPEPTRSIDALEENTHIGHRQFSAAQEAMRDVLRLKAIAIKEAADKLAAAPQPPQAERVPMTEDEMIGIMEKLGITVCGPASEAIEALARAIEAHHHIGVKP